MKNAKNQRRIIISILLLFSIFAVLNSCNAVDMTINSSTNFKNNIENVAQNNWVVELDADVVFSLSSSNNNIKIDKNITIKSSNSSKNAVIDLNKNHRLFDVTSNGHLTLINVTIKNGGGNAVENGGAIYNSGTLTVNGCIFTNNSVTHDGGAIVNYGNANITNSLFTNNIGKSIGGAIYNLGFVKLINCNFTNNSAIEKDGGAIENWGAANLTNCTFINNSAKGGSGVGGAIDNWGGSGSNVFLILDYCTFINNSANHNGGAIYNGGISGTAYLNASHCTFISNSAKEDGGAIYYNSNCIANISFSVFYKNADKSGLTFNGAGACVLKDNFYFWVNPKINNASYMSALLNSLTNQPQSIKEFYYLNITNNSAYYFGDTLIINKLAYYGTNPPLVNELPDLKIILNYNSQEIEDYDYRNGTGVLIDSLTNNFVFLFLGDIIYQMPLNVLAVSTIEVANNTGRTGQNITIYGNVTNNAGLIINGNVIIKINGNFYNVTVVNGKFNLTIILNVSGNYILNIEFERNETFAGSTRSAWLYIERTNTTLVVYNVSGIIGENVQLKANLRDFAGNPISGAYVSFYVNGIYLGYNITDANGIAIFNYILKVGDNKYFANFTGNDTYNVSKSVDVNITANKRVTIIVSDSVSGIIGESVQLIANLTDNGNPISGAYVSFYVNGNYVGYNITDINGIAIFNYILKVGDNKYFANYTGNDTYNMSKSADVNITSKKRGSGLVSNSVTGTIGESVQLIANLTDNGNPISGTYVFFYVNGNYVGYSITDVNGIAIFNYVLKSGDNDYFAYYAGNDTYNGSTSNPVNIVANKRATELVATPVSDIIGKTVQLIANLTDNGNPIVGAIVFFYVNGVLVGNSTTGFDGIAKFNYLVKDFDIEYFVKYGGDDTYIDSQSTAVDLIAIIDYNPLQDLIDKSKSLNSKDYTPETWAILQDAVSSAEAMISGKTAISQEEVTFKMFDLQRAIDQLIHITHPIDDFDDMDNNSTEYKTKETNEINETTKTSKTNKTIDKPTTEKVTTNISMKNTGIPIIQGLLLLLCIFGLVFVRKKQQ